MRSGKCSEREMVVDEQILRVENGGDQIGSAHVLRFFFVGERSRLVLRPLILRVTPNGLCRILAKLGRGLFIEKASIFFHHRQKRFAFTCTAESISIFFKSNCLSSYCSTLTMFFLRSTSGSTSLNLFSLGDTVLNGRAGTLIWIRA